MKVLVATPKFRYDTFAPDTPAFRAAELIFCDRRGTEADWLAAAGDAEVILVSPITPIRESLISRMPNLRLIHSEGVGFDLIDLETARKRGIYVCNNAGCNAGPVAEQAVMMMTMLLRRTLWGHRMVLEGRQGEVVPILERNVPEDLASSTVGLVGFGAIGRAAAERRCTGPADSSGAGPPEPGGHRAGRPGGRYPGWCSPASGQSPGEGRPVKISGNNIGRLGEGPEAGKSPAWAAFAGFPAAPAGPETRRCGRGDAAGRPADIARIPSKRRREAARRRSTEPEPRRGRRLLPHIPGRRGRRTA